MTMPTKSQRKNANDMGGKCPEIPRATIILDEKNAGQIKTKTQASLILVAYLKNGIALSLSAEDCYE